MTNKHSKNSRPKIPLHILVQEAYNLKSCCNNDKEYLTSRNFDWSIVTKLEETANNCSKAEAVWIATKTDCKVKTQRLHILASECTLLRTTLSRFLRVVAQLHYENPKLPWYSRRVKYADIVQDLFDLSKSFENKRELVLKAGFDFSIIDQAKEKALQLAKLVAYTINESTALSPERKKRNLLYKELDKLVTTVRQSAVLLLITYPERAARYHSSFYREQNNRRANKKSN
jgi:hypothetical protein